MYMEQPQMIEGKSVTLRPITVDDAEFILDLRQREDIACFFLNRIDITVEQEREWIRKSKVSGDYNFAICDKMGESIGLIALCNVEAQCAESGRFMSLGNAVQNIEACMLLYDFAFEKIGVNAIENVVVSHNGKVKGMHEKFGFVFNEKTEKCGVSVYHGILKRNAYIKQRHKISTLVDRASRII